MLGTIAFSDSAKLLQETNDFAARLAFRYPQENGSPNGRCLCVISSMSDRLNEAANF